MISLSECQSLDRVKTEQSAETNLPTDGFASPKYVWRAHPVGGQYTADVYSLARNLFRLASLGQLDLTQGQVETVAIRMIESAVVVAENKDSVVQQVRASVPRFMFSKSDTGLSEANCLRLANEVLKYVRRLEPTGDVKIHGLEGVVGSYKLLCSSETGTSDFSVGTKSAQNTVAGVLDVNSHFDSRVERTEYAIVQRSVRHAMTNHRIYDLESYPGSMPARLDSLRELIADTKWTDSQFHVIAADEYAQDCVEEKCGVFTRDRHYSKTQRQYRVSSAAQQIAAHALGAIGAVGAAVLSAPLLVIDPILVFAKQVVVTGWLPGER